MPEMPCVDAKVSGKGSLTPAARYRRISERLEDNPPSDRTLAVVEAQAMLIERVLATSPDDQADLAAVLARLMR